MLPKKRNNINQTDNDIIDRSSDSLTTTIVALLFLLLASSPAWGVTTIIPGTHPASNGLSCTGTRNGGTMVCAAKEFTVGTSFSAAPGTPPFCIAGTSFSFQVELALSGSNADRYDMAFYTGETGNDPQTNDVTKFCSVTTFPLTPIPFNNLDGNACGDYDARGDSIITINQIKSLCQGDSVGALTIPYTLTYFPNSSGTCTGPLDVLVPPTSKCQSATASVNGVTSIYSGAYVDVTKQTSPDGDTQPFSFSATGPAGSKVIALTGATLTATTATGGTYSTTAVLATNTTTVTLKDGETARIYINALATGQLLTITETVNAAWESTAAITCAAVTGSPTLNTATANTIKATLSSTNSAAACTVTNTKRPTVTKSFSPGIIAPGGTSDLTFKIYNYATAAKTFTLIDNTASGWPTGMTVVTPIPISNNCGGTLRNGGNTAALTANIANGFQLVAATVPALLAANNPCTLVLRVTVPSTGTYNNTTSGLVYAGGPGLGSNTASLLVAIPPTVNKDFSATNLASGVSTNLTVTIGNTNAGAITLTSLFTDTFPAGMTINTAGNSGTCNNVTAVAGAGSFTIANGTSIPAGGCTVIVNVKSSTAGVATNTIAIGALVTTAGSNTVAASDFVNIYAPPTVTKSFTPTSISVGGTSSMTITVTNPAANPDNLTGVSISDTYVGTLVNNAPGSMVCTGAGFATMTGGANLGTTVGFSAGTIVPGGTCTITQSVTATATVNNSTTAPTTTGPVVVTGTPAGPISLTTYSIPSIAKAFNPATVDIYTASTMTFTLSNTNGSPLTSANFTDTLTGFKVATPATIGGTCVGVTNSPALAVGDTALNLTVPNLAAGSCTITIPVSASSAGSYTNTTSGLTTVETGAVAGPPSNTASLTVSFLPLQVTKTPSVMTAAPGTLVTYDIGYSNPNATTPLQNIVITDPVPLYTTYDSASCGPLPATITSCNVSFSLPPAGWGNGTAAWTLGGTLDAGSSGFVRLSVQIQ